MNKHEAPLIEGLTLERIGNILCDRYKYKKIALGDFIYCSAKTFSRKATGKSKVFKKDVDNLIESLTGSLCGGSETAFYKLIKEWFPALNSFHSPRDIRIVFTANLMGTACDDTLGNTLVSYDNSLTTLNFFQSCLEQDSPIKCIKLSAHTGWSWFDDTKKRKLFKLLADNGIEILIIGNSMTPAIENIILSLREPEKELYYKGVNAMISEWHKFETFYPNIKLHISTNYPALHQLYLVEFADGSAQARIRDYVYQSPTEKIPPRRLTNNESEYECYNAEFQFLWDNGLTYDDWKRSLPKPKEPLPTGSYILMYPSHQKEDTPTSKWIYCELSISDNHKISMKVNVPKENITANSIKKWEYSYDGDANVTGKMIFISLNDESHEESITISIPRPVRDVDRYIGIMNALNPSGNAPVSFKFACFKRSLLSQIDYTRLQSLLTINNQMYNNNLMIIEAQDTDLFYSDKIFSE